MQFEKLLKIAKEKKVKIGFLNKGLYKLLAPIISDDEVIKDMAEGLDNKSANKVPVIVTNKSIYICKFVNAFGGFDQKVIPLNKVTSVSSGGAMILTKLFINEGTTEHVVDRIGLKANELVKSISALLNNTEATTTTNSSISDLRELKSLLDDEIITKEEFEAKKKQLLGI